MIALAKTMEENIKIKLSNQQISTSLSGETVILNHEKGIYFSLNEVGTFVWEQLENNQIKTFGELKSAILNEFEIDEATCITDLTQIISDLINEKLAEKVG